MQNNENPCRKFRTKLQKMLARRFAAPGGWLDNHIATCPKCRARVRRVGMVEFAISALKSQPHTMDLVTQANTRAIKVLKHSLREAPKAQKLQTTEEEQTWNKKSGVYLAPLSKTAACLAVVLCMKVGILSSMDSFRRHGDSAVRHHYAKYLDQEYADEIYPA